MAAATDVVLRAKGVDQASGVFRKIGAAFAGWKIGSTIREGVGELGKLSDVAMRAGISTDELTSMSGALNQIGIKGADVEAVADAFQRMTKNTGAQGLEGFEAVIREISKISDVQKRSEAVAEAFGKTGLHFLPLVEKAAKDGSSGLLELANTMPRVSQKAAEAGDAANDAIGYITAQIKFSFLNVLGDALIPFADKMKELPGGFAGLMNAISQELIYFFARVYVQIQQLSEYIVAIANMDISIFKTSWSEKLDKKFMALEQQKQMENQLFLDALKSYELKNQNISLKKTATAAIKATGPQYAGAMLSGSYAAAQFAIGNGMNGDSPEVRETRKQTNVLNAMYKTVQHINSMLKPNSFEYGTL